MKRILAITVIVITLINLAAVATVFLNLRAFRHEHPPVFPVEEKPGDSVASRPGPAYLMHELGFSDQQKSEFRASKQEFFTEAHPLFDEMNALNQQLFEQVRSNKPDSAQLRTICAKQGQLQGRIKWLTIKHLMDVKSIAAPDQREKLEFFYRELLSRDSRPGGGQRQYRYRHGRNNGN